MDSCGLEFQNPFANICAKKSPSNIQRPAAEWNSIENFLFFHKISHGIERFSPRFALEEEKRISLNGPMCRRRLRREETLPSKCYKIMMPAPFMLSLRRTRLCNAIKNRHKFLCSHLQTVRFRFYSAHLAICHWDAPKKFGWHDPSKIRRSRAWLS